MFMRTAGRLLAASRPILLGLIKTAVVQTKQSHLVLQRLPAAAFSSSSIRLNQNIVKIQTEDNFDEVVKDSEIPVIVDFYATWCGPCKILGPRLHSAITQMDGAVKLLEVDIDKLPDLAIEHGVEAVPTVLAFKNGKIQDKFMGLKDETELVAFLKKLSGT